MTDDKPEYVFGKSYKAFNMMMDKLKRLELIEQGRQRLSNLSIYCLITSALGNLLSTIANHYHVMLIFWAAMLIFLTSIGFFVAFIVLAIKIKRL